ncbi:xanthine dehydrogenase accessory factor [Quadrisphaera granulorum]|uniref:Xanthine dehydrogenase accessory factor n=1 Tax=Quadrisphaera granulorum TaxID=317664 RepID=A0A316AC86_9ACTN|nr:XdhC family protein [Quadrisphaera granulorum]PWJ55231.1 xanthine dehydrogenase accessory factor [Quadrisphaera granulorum]SZE95740.1 xanthine dehydrogenase accessory factor [Quadrisphaera granulorum]
MLDIIDGVLAAVDDGRRVVLAVVARTWSSSPRPVGSAMAVLDDGSALGSVSGGCVEGDVFARAADLVEPELVHYGVSDDDAFAVGLPCGGALDVLLRPLDADLTRRLRELARARDAGRPARLALELPEGGTVEVAAEEPAHLVIAGASAAADALAAQGRLLRMRVTVVDAREAFATPQRLPSADEVVVDWPHRWLGAQAAAGRVGPTTSLVVLTHDAKFDLPLLELALRLDLGYVGAMGSRRTCAARRESLRQLGLGERELARLHAPVGLDLGGRSPAEMALSIAAELVAVRHGRRGEPLCRGAGPIHSGHEASVNG